ncbi:urea carboxylase [Corynebacterium efficiens YS-314]|uniref:Putative urea carboxylase n=1 Tax=Corynebacterium efficiens (strain DSM 44549 / YS-314 / AJ 12310 / JCM 11189 / NBRC 100395) TaxID=196164 RepID=Q8FRP6_COREF|nr:urea carboxylase [Corynebacterium efficiens]EEW50347.1 urea carboxylase [Corynebacterium efficiens YS-314]BAC17523.1 putative urea carboxylase [Corynebacterium efficiens YS-314]
MFDSILIANRGEIARRIIRTARRMGLRTIAIYSEADAAAPHVREADEAHLLGPAPAAQSYLDIDRVLDIAVKSGAGAIHPGYGFLSENAEFARLVEAAGIAFVGPTPEQLDKFGIKHTARQLAEAAGVPLLPGTGLLSSADEAVAKAQEIGLPVMVKASNGGGGIGMQSCTGLDQVREAFTRVQRLAEQNFGSGGVFLERLVRPARHIEVQVFGDGAGAVAVFGDRDCSLQRRNQKVVEEAPAPDLPPVVRQTIHQASRALAASVDYRSAGTVEFIYDPHREEAYFLEMNTRLQVEHPVTEAVFDVDLVELMLRQAGARDEGEAGVNRSIFEANLTPRGVAVEARVYAEDPAKECAPSSGVVTRAVFPGQGGDPMENVRIDGWIETGLEVSPHYDPMLAKIITHAATRNDALDLLHGALAVSRVDGIVTNLPLLRALVMEPTLRAADHSTSTLEVTSDPEPRIDVLEPGMLTTVQDWPGRRGFWKVGVPPSGPMDSVSFRLANEALGNDASAPGLECTSTGPVLRFSHATRICITGAPALCMLSGQPIPQWVPIDVRSGDELHIGETSSVGLRTYLAVEGGLDVPDYLGSASTFTLGQFGGHAGRALLSGDVLRPVGADPHQAVRARPIPEDQRPVFSHHWRIAVTEGPHEAPDFFTPEDIEVFYSSDYVVHLNSARSGVRLDGPNPTWARTDGGEAGMHPSNIHDNAYAIGAIDFTGDTPIILGPDGPSLGGFVCPAVVTSGDLWKLGQLRPGDTVRFVPVREADAADTIDLRATPELLTPSGDGDHGVLARVPEDGDRPSVTYRRAGDTNLLIEYGEQVLDIGLRMRVHVLHTEIEKREIPGVTDLTPGIRSLQLQVDPAVIRPSQLVELMMSIEEDLPATEELAVPSRTVRLPLSWDDPQTRLAIERYMNGVRDDAPWCPWNIEFIRRVNGLDTVDDVYRTVFNASYLVLGLGDVYLGAPVATPLDPRHRLVTTKYNPARTWTPENAVGIGGAYLCVYGMEGPGGYQFVGRTTQMWNRYRTGGLFQDAPWALRFFDRIEWYPVSAEELLEMRTETDAGRGRVEVEEGTFSFAEYREFLDTHADSIREFQESQTAAFDEEKQRWRESGEFDIKPEPAANTEEAVIPEGSIGVSAPLMSTLWQFSVTLGDRVSTGDQLLSLEAMKMETAVSSPVDGVVTAIHASPGDQVTQGQILISVASE